MSQHFVIIGNGVAGIEAAFTLRKRLTPSQARITIVSRESDYFFSRTALMYAFMNRLAVEDLEPYERHVYPKQRLTLLRDTVTDLDAEQKTLSLKDSPEPLRYDKLLIASGASPRTHPFPGLDAVEEGLVHFVSLQDLAHCERLTPSTRHAVIVGGGLIGVELVESLRHHGIPVTFLVREPSYWPAALSPREGAHIADHIRSHGVDLRLETSLASVQTDPQGRVSAVITSAGDTIACQMLGLCIGVQANVSWLAQATTPPRIARGLCVDPAFRTSLPDVFGAGDCVELIDHEAETSTIETIWYSAKRHGELAALSMLGDAIHYTPPLFYNSSRFFEVEYTTVGQVLSLPEGARALWRTHPTHPHLTQLITFSPNEQDRVLGFNLLGSRWNHRILERWILERRTLGYVREHLHAAQFDVEFGRARLATMREEIL